MSRVVQTRGPLRQGRGRNGTRTTLLGLGVKGNRAGRCWCDRGRDGRDGLLGCSPLLRQPGATFHLLTFHSTPSSTLSDFPLPVFLLVHVLLCLLSTLSWHPALVRLARVIVHAIQNVEVVLVALPLLLSSLASLAPLPHPPRAQRLRAGGVGTAVVH